MQRFLQYLRLLLKWRKLIAFNCIGLTAVAAIVSFLLPQRFTAVAQLLPPPEEDVFGISSTLGGGLSGSRLNRLVAGAVLGGATPSDLMVGVLGSRSVMQSVIERCSIMDYYRVKNRSMEEAIKTLAKMTDISVSDEGIVGIGVEAKTPNLAAKTANAYVDELDNFMRTSNISRGRNMRVFIERRLSEVESTLARKQGSLESFQMDHRTVSIDDEASAAIDAYAQMRSRLYLREAELAMLESMSGSDNPGVGYRRAEIDASKRQLRRLEGGQSGDGFGVGFAIPFDSLPAVSSEYLRRYRDVKVQEEAYLLLYQQYEYAKILEARDTPSLTILDRAVPPERRSFPRRWVIVLGALLFSFSGGVAFAFIAEYFDRIRQSRPEEYEGWLDLRRQISAVLRRTTRVFSSNKKRS